MNTGPSEPHACDAAVSLAFSILGKRWNAMIVDALSAGPLSFAALRRTVAGISDAVLSDRLTELAEAALLSRVVEPGPPVAVTYTLTRSGEQLVPVLRQLGQWASMNLPHPSA
ncbi:MULTISPECIES: helix-turn-helix domain-containing protein [unclassified Arthrobacter]|uniref:winged helix-turn-helix transcriptional regulator n=1 Tax=unclassified Arthrobacter TaxID=235627 RepID=UPI001E546F53|nr:MULTISPECIES: helix-turn-helix domain-containing protein [unclassified Arthrobacter]MCC9145949.1 helix-turn-helix transcriptional regulator [Arthrobacter sp. zg-Y919]MDK1277178.1 helix-turn-helix domain-containing protein [Arthrobacter sp. zg.Y919]WIB03693.1 helix-turn-helix domain-containing protein [Arthrobacter sp. zg-Y919]